MSDNDKELAQATADASSQESSQSSAADAWAQSAFKPPDYTPTWHQKVANEQIPPGMSTEERSAYSTLQIAFDTLMMTRGGSELPVVPIEQEDPLIGSVLENKYQIIDIIGRGGMAIVYRAQQVGTDRIFAVKGLKVTKAEDMIRFAREIKNHSGLKHRNIPAYYESISTAKGEFFLVMERIKGISLLEIIRTIGRIDDPENIATIMMQVCDALSYAHARGVIHRDLKASNIVLVKEGENQEIVVKVLDFGIAKIEGDMRITYSGLALGSPIYMSPEQCRGETLGIRSDLYSLGVVAYEMFTGQPPYKKGSVRDIMSAHCNPLMCPEPIIKLVPHIKGASLLNEILQKALETEADKRWPNAARLKEAFEYWIDSVRSGRITESLPASLLEEQQGEEQLEDADYMLSQKDIADLHQIRPKKSMEVFRNDPHSTKIDEEGDEADQKKMKVNKNFDSLHEAKKLLTTQVALSLTLLVVLGVYFNLKGPEMMAVLSKPKPAEAKAAPPVKPAEVTKPAPKKPTKKQPKKRRKRRD
jgi:Serine/threonine protein kinase